MSNSVNSIQTIFRGNRSISTWLILLLGLGMGLTAAFLIVQQAWLWLFALALLVPAIALTFVYPFAIVLVWLLVLPFFLHNIAPGSRYIFWLLHRTMIPATLGLVVLQNITGIRKRKPVRLGFVDLVMIAFLLLSLANILLISEAPVTKLIRYYDRIFIPFCMFWLIRLVVPGERDLHKLVPVALFIIFSQGVIGLLSWFAPNLLPVQWLTRINQRTIGTLRNPAVYCFAILFSATLLIQVNRQNKAAWIRTATLAVVGFAFFLVYFSFSRGSWLGTLLFLFGLIFIDPKTFLKLALVGILLAVIFLELAPQGNYLSFSVERLLTQDTAEGRVIGGAASIEMIKLKPLTGWGFGDHELYDEQFRQRVFDLATNEEASSHNTYLLIAAEMGLPGLFLYFLPAAWLLLKSIFYWRWLPKEGMLSKSFLFMLWLLIFSHSIAALFTDLIQSNFYNTVIWWLSLGLIANILETGEDAVKNLAPSRTTW